MDFEIHLRSLRGHKGVKGQIYKDAPIELKFQYSDPYDILSILKIFCNSFEVIKGSQSGQRSIWGHWRSKQSQNLTWCALTNISWSRRLNLQTQVNWGQRDQKAISTKNATSPSDYMVWSCNLKHMNQLDTFHRFYGSRSHLKVIWGHRGQVIILALF